ncbi:RAMP superfamily CRISPR-associated protein [Candidatus Cloacimonadaceae bacterium]
MSSTIKEFWLLSLHFKSALHIGRGSSDTFMGAAEIIENGAGIYVIPGTSIAGVFFSTLMTCVQPQDRKSTLWKELTGEGKKNNDDSTASWLVFRSAEIDPKLLQVRDKVSINRKTKTAKDGAKFTAWEIIPNDLEVLIEFDNLSRHEPLSDANCIQLIKWIDAVLSSWQIEGFFLGAYSGTGSGYVKLKDINHCSLNSTNFHAYLDASYQDLPAAKMGWQIYKPQTTDNKFKSAFLSKYSLKVKVDYQNPLLIKGGVSYVSYANPNTDAPFIHRDGKPFIPGSSIRGAISSFMDKYAKANWKILLGQPKDDDQSETGGYIIFTDLLMQKEGKLMQIERHAEDQFSRAIYGSGKFDEERLFNAEFYGEIFVLSGAPIAVDELDKLFAFLKSGIDLNMISLGSGACYPKITLEELS